MESLALLAENARLQIMSVLARFRALSAALVLLIAAERVDARMLRGDAGNLRSEGADRMSKTAGIAEYGYRYYAPMLGRWVSRDPIGERGGVNLYGMVSNNPIGRIDLLGLSTRADVISGRLRYSCNCGWIDYGHANMLGKGDGLAGQLWKDVSSKWGPKSRTGNGFKVSVYMSQGKVLPIIGMIRRGVTNAYFVEYGQGTAGQKSQALGIFIEMTDQFEAFQGGFPDGIASGGSSNSEEDRPSNLIGFYKAVEGYSLPDIEKWCKVQSAADSLKIWDATGGLGKSTSWSPTYKKAPCCTGKPTWPKQFNSIKPAAKGTTWRDWRIGGSLSAPAGVEWDEIDTMQPML